MNRARILISLAGLAIGTIISTTPATPAAAIISATWFLAAFLVFIATE